MLKIILLVLIAFSLPIPLWLIILHIILKRCKGLIRKTTFFSLGLLWILSLFLVFKYQLLIISTKFEPNIFIKTLALILLIIALLIDYKVIKVLGFKRLTCVVELQKKDKPDLLITNGIYKHARHPRYVEYFLLSLFIGLFFGYQFFIYFSVYILFGFYIATIFEEKELIKRFGKDYLEYKKNVPRFFFKIK
ncbi:MAG TPA: methyltransferase [Candidatus Nanoarchaeia archaeon]|nr:methyltransferase [Candidatus Nanoarchaeia archaeon]